MPLAPGKKNIGRNIAEMERSHPRNVAVAAALRTAYGPRKRANGGHVGPLPGPTPGRADKVETTVEDGSHILNSACVAALGDGNSEAGYQRLLTMFPHSTPSRASGGSIGAPNSPHVAGIAGMPHIGGLPHLIIPHPHITALPHLAGAAGAPHMTGIGPLAHMAKGGEAQQVPVKLSHGEFCVSKRDVKDVAGKGDLERGHRALDHFQVMVVKEYAKKLKHLPGPSKD